MSITSFSGEHRFLSNFWPAEVEFQGIKFPSVEHAYVAAKTTDIEMRKAIAAVSTAGKVKRLGRELDLRPDWEQIKLEVMLYLVKQKFEHPELRKLLMATKPHELIEGNTWGDTFWGVCVNKEGDPVGLNHLGLILMHIRDSE